jgi:hypothetical protein
MVWHPAIRGGLGWGNDNPAFRQFFTSPFILESTPERARSLNELYGTCRAAAVFR